VRVYVTGGAGFIGSNVGRVFAERHCAEVLCTTRSALQPEPTFSRWVNVDLLNRDALFEIVTHFKPHAIVHAAILNDFAALYSDRKHAWESYVGMTRNVVDAANNVGALVVLISTDWVFDGTQSRATEDTPPRPLNFYGFLKAASELVVVERASRSAIARTSGVNGIHWVRPQMPRSQDPGFGYLVLSLVEALCAGREFMLWEGNDLNEVASPILATDLAELLWRIVDREAEGIFHCCGANATTRHELAVKTVEVFDLDPAFLTFGPVPTEERLPVPDRIPFDTSLNGDVTMSTLGVQLPHIDSLLHGLKFQIASRQISSYDIATVNSNSLA
jgi:dTDP-4-dehydrorhamnose reductase